MTQFGEATRCCWSSETSPDQPRAPPHKDTLGTGDSQSPGREGPGGSVPRMTHTEEEGSQQPPHRGAASGEGQGNGWKPQLRSQQASQAVWAAESHLFGSEKGERKSSRKRLSQSPMGTSEE